MFESGNVAFVCAAIQQGIPLKLVEDYLDWRDNAANCEQECGPGEVGVLAAQLLTGDDAMESRRSTRRI